MTYSDKGRILGLESVSPENKKKLRCRIAAFVCSSFVVACIISFCIFYFTFKTDLPPHPRLDLGRILGLELVSPENTKRLRCSIAVFVCWAFVVASALTFCIFYFALAKKPSRLDIDIHESWYLRRADWQAMPDYGIELLNLPVSYVLIGHTATDICTDRYDCIKQVLDVQRDHQRRGWDDIGPNYLVGGNGLVFEGRGANLQGVMVSGWNRLSITIMFIGNYIDNKPNQEQFINVSILLEELVKVGVLNKSYIVYGHCQVIGGIETPGGNLLDDLHYFKHWDEANVTSCLRK